MGGRIQVRSVENSGSTFEFNLPVQLVAAMPTIEEKPQREIIALEPGQPQYRILVVDDESDNRQLLLELLEPLGFAVEQAADGEQAITLWQTWQPDLVLMDIRMPKIDGYEAIARIKAICSNTRIIALTASAMDSEPEIIRDLGCDDFMSKPFLATELLTMMTKHLGVCYTWADKGQKSELETWQFHLDSSSFDNWSNELLLELKQSILAIDLEQIEQILTEIESQNHSLAKTLERYIDNFEYEQILNLLPNK